MKMVMGIGMMKILRGLNVMLIVQIKVLIGRILKVMVNKFGVVIGGCKLRLRGEAVHRDGQRGERRVREQGAGATKEANGTEPTEPRRLICAQSGRAQRTKQTARKSTGGAAPRRQLVGKPAGAGRGGVCRS